MSDEAMPTIDDGELTMVNTLSIRESDLDAYLAELREVLPQARALDACLFLEAGQALDDPTTIILTEHWRSGTEYVHTVLALPFYQKYLTATESMYASPRSVVVLATI